MKNSVFIFLFFFPLLSIAQLKSKLEIYNIETNQREILYEERTHFEAPNWSRDGAYLVINSLGKLYRVDINSPKKQLINTNFADKCNNDHGISPNGNQLVISHYDDSTVTYDERDFRTSRIYTLPIEGGVPKPITTNTPSFWHAWSPDGTNLLYTALRNEEFDIYAIGANGGKEQRLTYEKGLDDGADYSADGKHIYYNSMQSGRMEIWRMNSNGSEKEQLTNDIYSNWFPHPSPDGKHFVFLSYLEDQGDRHSAMKRVALRLYNLENRVIRTLCQFVGGQGTINVPSWSPDGKSFAFVSYADNDLSAYVNQLYVFTDGEMPASAYIDGKLDANKMSSKDNLQILKFNEGQLEVQSELAVSNSVRRWPNSADFKKIGVQKYLLSAEQDGQAPTNAQFLRQIKKADQLFLINISDATQPKVLDSLSFDQIPTCVAFHPNQNLFALTFIGSNKITLGKVLEDKLQIINEVSITLPNQKVSAIPHFTWHPDGNFAAITLAGNDRLVFLKFEDQKLIIWGNILKTAPLPGVGYFTSRGDLFILTTINLTSDLEQAAYGHNTSLLSIYRFDSDELPNSPRTRENDGVTKHAVPATKHTKTAQLPFGQGYVETFAISPDDKYIVGLNMKASWLPENALGRTSFSTLELFKLNARTGKAKFISNFPFAAILPECIQFDPSGNFIFTASFDNNMDSKGKGSIDIWNFVRKPQPIIAHQQQFFYSRGVHYFLLD